MRPMKGNSIKEEVNYTFKKSSPKFCKSYMYIFVYLTGDQGPSLYYVRIFGPFLNHLPPCVRTFPVHKVREGDELDYFKK